MEKNVAIIQARIGSTRLPCKMMLSLHGHPIIEWVVERVRSSKMIDDIVVAIPDTSDNNILEFFLTQTFDVKVYRGSENDVLKRFYDAAKLCGADNVIRICADNPFITGSVLDDLIVYYTKNNCDYAYNQGDGGKSNTYPDGFGAQILPFSLLEWLEKTTTKPSHREHCLSYITDNPDQFKIKTFNPDDIRIADPKLKLDIDTLEDYHNLMLTKVAIDSTPFEIVQAYRKVL